MAKAEENKAPGAPNEGKKDGPVVADYLVSPKKKRRQFIVLALSAQFDVELRRDLIKFVKMNYPHLTISEPQSADEFRRQFGRKVVLLIMDDEFEPIEEVMALIKDLKKRKRDEAVPVLFLTKQPDHLVKVYHDHLYEYHEVDEFCPYHKMTKEQVLSRVKVGVEQNNRRRSRRYLVDVPITFFHLSHDKDLPGAITDMSAHGAKIEADDTNFLFKVGDQLRLAVPVREFCAPDEGEYVHLSGKVRRVFMAGNSAGLSFEYVTDKQSLILAKILSVLVDRVPKKKNF